MCSGYKADVGRRQKPTTLKTEIVAVTTSHSNVETICCNRATRKIDLSKNKIKKIDWYIFKIYKRNIFTTNFFLERIDVVKYSNLKGKSVAC